MENEARTRRPSQRAQLSCAVLSHIARQLRSRLIYNVRQNMKRKPIPNPKLDALLVGLVICLFGAFLSPVVLEYNTWRWPVCAAFAGLSVAMIVAHSKISAREKEKIYLEPRPASRVGRRALVLCYALVVPLALVGFVAFGWFSVVAFRSGRYRTVLAMVSFAVGCVGVALSAVRGIRLQKEPNQTPEPTPTAVTPAAAHPSRQP